MIYLLRHGETEDNDRKRYIGQFNSQLTERGRQQAEGWRKKLSAIDFDAIYSSDLSRCFETAKIIADNKKILISEKLREINLGEWEGLYRDDVKEKFPDEWARRGNDMGYRPPGGESFEDLKNRIMPVFDGIAGSADKDILIITHAGVIKVIICRILDMPLNRLFAFIQDYAGMNLIKNHMGSIQLISMNLRI